ncbi:MAG: DNA adenine methylase [Anaerovoracaceae bacterium]
MKYVGSKNRISKELAPIIQSYITADTKGYIEPFVGGANMIDKIVCDNKFGYDTQKYLIALLKQSQKDYSVFPDTITEDEYSNVKNNKSKYDGWYVGLVGFCSVFGAKWFGGYARGFKEDKKTLRDIPNESIRNLKKQSKSLNGIKFECKDFRTIRDIRGYVVYCDPPYRDTTKYSTSDFPYDEFYDWCRDMSKNNTVLVSEYNMPDDFECIWSKEVKTSLDVLSQKNRTEKLFFCKTAYYVVR